MDQLLRREKRNNVKPALIIAGSDTLSGGGLQADVRTFQRFGITSHQLLTCIVTMNPQNEHISIFELSEKEISTQLGILKTVGTYGGVKVGMLANLKVAHLIKDFLKTEGSDKPLVIDPVLALKESGFETSETIIQFFKDELIPLATIITPNLHEAELLSGISPIDTVAKMKEAACRLKELGTKSVVIKGGLRFPGIEAVDLFYDGTEFLEFRESKLATSTNNGAGCTFASAITCYLMMGHSLPDSVKQAKAFVYLAIENGIAFLPNLGNVWQGFRESE